MTLGINDKNIEELARKGWLSYSSKTGVKVLPSGRKKARETMQEILEYEKVADVLPSSTFALEMDALYITELYLTHEIAPRVAQMEGCE
jgi:hypothetical protein